MKQDLYYIINYYSMSLSEAHEPDFMLQIIYTTYDYASLGAHQ